jgi:hypothetical protein
MHCFIIFLFFLKHLTDVENLISSRTVASEPIFCFSRGGVVSTSSNPQTIGEPPVGCPPLLIQCTLRSPPYRRPFLHPQPEEAPCRGDRNPQNAGLFSYMYYIVYSNCQNLYTRYFNTTRSVTERHTALILGIKCRTQTADSSLLTPKIYNFSFPST